MAITYLESIVVGALQGVSELFPVSSLGHSILMPAWVGGQWAKDLDMSAKDSPYLALLVAMHVATALALVIFFRRDWVRIIGGLWDVLRTREIRTPEARLGVLLIVATIPVGLAGLLLEKAVRNYLGTPIPTSIFLALNGFVLLSAELLRTRVKVEAVVTPSGRAADLSSQDTVVLPIADPDRASDLRLSQLGVKNALLIGSAQIAALFPGISRSGSTIVAGLFKGMSHEDAARFAFMLATPVILAAGVLKMPELFKPENHDILGPALAGSVVAGVLSYISIKFLTAYFETKTLTPFAIYCLVAGIGSLVFFSIQG
ncbi:undecaprenyl-diphosphate phosphatase [Nocardia sp. SYP-A9097]|uniref:undecaprenyl-diphosphate phosphatase n=1 Tax=Nocardia sp. SYP-A9097 TaxID=2663237 RepID=UPI00129ACBF7|nr:undecaprenyl-diphosphate phosphatase [Nocardia sp. SYP-A9097]MRH93119.1 undecaprenyl-diphosphate phosphatase [Nocardia sp. SYP-A9097]